MKNYKNWNVTILGENISPEKKERFNSRVKELIASNSTILYRGESKMELMSKFDKNGTFPRPFLDRLFLIGEKGRNFLEDLSGEIKKRYHISNTDDSFFEEIFEMIGSLLNKKIQHVSRFIESNTEFAEYFSNNNKKDFISKIQSLDKTQKINVRDFYLTLLHSHSKSIYYPISAFISTTTKEEIALGFQGKRTSNEDKIMIISWVPKEKVTNQYLVTFDYLNTIYGELLALGLPVYYTRFFHQEEVTIKGGLLPNYIFGIKYYSGDEQRFSVNPWFVHQDLNSDWITDGLPINQSGFWNELKNTSFKGAFHIDVNGYDEELISM